MPNLAYNSCRLTNPRAFLAKLELFSRKNWQFIFEQDCCEFINRTNDAQLTYTHSSSKTELASDAESARGNKLKFAGIDIFIFVWFKSISLIISINKFAANCLTTKHLMLLLMEEQIFRGD